MDRHKYDTPLNEHLVTANAMCAFRFGLDKICLIEIPDFENVGYINGYIFYISGKSYFHDIAGGSEGLSNYAANTYAQYLADCEKHESLEPIMGEDDLWILDDDTSMEFHHAFDGAMADAGYVMREDGGWEYKNSWNIHELLDYLVDIKDSITVQTNDGWGNTCWLCYSGTEGVFEYEDSLTAECHKTRSELVAMYPNNEFTEDDHDD
jgi:hypothetical protein